MTLNLLPPPAQPVTREAGRAELVSIWDGLDADGRRMLMAQARAVAEVTGRVRDTPEPRA
ncbi:hypothetical protein SAMN02745194_00489 [Roseomonas rosea]|uniref:Uncharacterized protein n=1 Tax=Muricoccus roseus TaxID=198092 RepID=A0A1M6BG95_9PROT|nr:hypothetical protein [Roseomonas rosea]SHI47741.1 hypothetical protein SAMN02745194_00489 [Roseomonas rosea]